jgi:hypothetical protein
VNLHFFLLLQTNAPSYDPPAPILSCDIVDNSGIKRPHYEPIFNVIKFHSPISFSHYFSTILTSLLLCVVLVKFQTHPLIHCDDDCVGRIKFFYARGLFLFSFLLAILRLTPRIYYRLLNRSVAHSFVYVLCWLFYF